MTGVRGNRGAGAETFPQAFAALLKARKLTVPKGLLEAPPDAYARQDASAVDGLTELSNAELKEYAKRVTDHVKRQQARAKRSWDTSPLIKELRRRKLKEPPAPMRPVGASVSLAKPLAKWTDAQIVRAAQQWSKLGS